MKNEMNTGSLVAVVDDDPAVCRSLGRLLSSNGYGVRTFTDAHDYVTECADIGPACLVLDLRIAEVNGLQLFEETDAAGKAVPTIFITGMGDVASSVRAIKRGAVDFIEKPFDDLVLLDAVERAITRYRDLRQETELLRTTLQRFCGMTTREAEVCTLVTAGWLNKQIAAALGIAEKTVKVHRARVMDKMRAGSVAELVITVDWMFRMLQGHAHGHPARRDGNATAANGSIQGARTP